MEIFSWEYLIAAVVGLLIQFALIRWAVRADDTINHQKAMIALLMKLCEKQGLSSDEIESIKNYYRL